MSRPKASTILFSSPMAWLEKLFINFSAHLSSGRCDSLLSWSLSCDFWAGSTINVFSAIMCFSLFVTNEICVITPRISKSWQICQWYSSHRDYFRLAAMKCYFPFVNTVGFPDDNWNTFICIWILFLSRLPNPFHISYTPLTFHSQSSPWNNCSVNYATFFLEGKGGEIFFCFNMLKLSVRNKPLIWIICNKIVCHIYIYMYVCLENFWKETQTVYSVTTKKKERFGVRWDKDLAFPFLYIMVMPGFLW